MRSFVSATIRTARYRVCYGLATMAVAVAVTNADGQVPNSTGLLAKYNRLQAAYATELASLADRLDAAGSDVLAETIRDWPVPFATQRDWLFVPSAAKKTMGLPANAEFTAARKRYAADLWDLAQRAAESNQPSLAVQLAHSTIREDLTHAPARKMVRIDDPTRKIRSGVGKVSNKTYEWDPGKYRWARSEHFQLLTTCDSEIAETLVNELEILYSVWSQLFAEFRCSGNVFRRAWERGELPADKRSKYRVVLFAGRDEYLSQLRRWEPRIALSEGVYRYQQRAAFFYYDKAIALDHVRHEVVHQLFHEATVYGSSQGAGAGVGEDQDFWAIEGVAMYFESMRRHEGVRHGYITLGGPDAERLQFARHRALNANEYTPMADFTMMGREAVQADPRVRQLYSQAGGLAHFFMAGQQQAYRGIFRDYLWDLYSSKKSEQTLAHRARVSFAELDDEYMNFLSLEDADLTDIAPRTRRLSLGNTRVTDDGVFNLVPLPRLDWLDLSATQITDKSASSLSKLTDLETLWLASTNITDASVPSLAKLTKLTELDLRGTHVTAEGRQQLRAALPNLQTLLPSN